LPEWVVSQGVETARQGCAGQPFQRMLRGGGEIRQACGHVQPHHSALRFLVGLGPGPPGHRQDGGLRHCCGPHAPQSTARQWADMGGGTVCVWSGTHSLSESTCRSKIPAIRHPPSHPPTAHPAPDIRTPRTSALLLHNRASTHPPEHQLLVSPSLPLCRRCLHRSLPLPRPAST